MNFTTVSKCLIILSGQYKYVYIAGDFNIDLMKYESETKYRELYNMSSYSYLPLIIQPTRITETMQSLIDNILANCLDKVCLSGKVLIDMADQLTPFALITKQKSDNDDNNYYFKRDKKMEWKLIF